MVSTPFVLNLDARWSYGGDAVSKLQQGNDVFSIRGALINNLVDASFYQVETKTAFPRTVKNGWCRWFWLCKGFAPVVEMDHDALFKPLDFNKDTLIRSILVCVPDNIGGCFMNGQFQLPEFHPTKPAAGIPFAEISDKSARALQMFQL